MDISQPFAEVMAAAWEGWTMSFWLSIQATPNYLFSHSWTPGSTYSQQCLHLALWSAYAPADTGKPTMWVRAGAVENAAGEASFAERLQGYCIPEQTVLHSGELNHYAIRFRARSDAPPPTGDQALTFPAEGMPGEVRMEVFVDGVFLCGLEYEVDPRLATCHGQPASCSM